MSGAKDAFTSIFESIGNFFTVTLQMLLVYFLLLESYAMIGKSVAGVFVAIGNFFAKHFLLYLELCLMLLE